MPVDILATSKSPHVFSCHSNPHKSLAVFFHLQRCYSDGISNKFVLSSTHDLHLFWMSPIDVMTGQMCYVHVKHPQNSHMQPKRGKRENLCIFLAIALLYYFSFNPNSFLECIIWIQVYEWLIWIQVHAGYQLFTTHKLEHAVFMFTPNQTT